MAVCGRRDAVMPRNVQKDEEASLTWTLKDELVRRGNVYYAKLARGKAMFLAPRMIPHFHALWGLRRVDEKRRLSRNAQKILRVLRREWEIATADLRADSGVRNRYAFTTALDELQAAMLVVPSEVYYQPKFTYIWTLSVGRFPDALMKRVRRETALREIARAFLDGAGMTIPGELARVTGLSRREAGLGNRALVAEGCATMHAPGLYQRKPWPPMLSPGRSSGNPDDVAAAGLSLRSASNAVGNSPSEISCAVSASRPGFKSVASRRQTSRRVGIGRITESMPSSFTPRRMNGSTVVRSSVPPVKPELAMQPFGIIVRVSHASVAPPTGSIAPAHIAFSSGRVPICSVSRARMCLAPSDRR